jgi:hypothetical protein
MHSVHKASLRVQHAVVEKEACYTQGVESDKETEDGAGSPYAAAGFSSWRRTLQIYSFAISFALRYWKLGKKGTYKKMDGGMSKENVSAQKAQLAKWLKDGLIRLGPTFIKIGQQFSTRVDVLSQEFIKELEELQDNVCSSISCESALGSVLSRRVCSSVRARTGLRTQRCSCIRKDHYQRFMWLLVAFAFGFTIMPAATPADAPRVW